MHEDLDTARAAYEARAGSEGLATVASGPKLEVTKAWRSRLSEPLDRTGRDENGGGRKTMHADLDTVRAAYEARAREGELDTIPDGPLFETTKSWKIRLGGATYKVWRR